MEKRRTEFDGKSSSTTFHLVGHEDSVNSRFKMKGRVVQLYLPVIGGQLPQPVEVFSTVNYVE